MERAAKLNGETMREEEMIRKYEHDEKIRETHKPFEGFSEFSTHKHFYFKDLENTYIDINEFDDITYRYVFNKFQWFPEGIYGEIFYFHNGGDEYDYETISAKPKKFILIKNNLEDSQIDIAGEGWTSLRNKKSLYNFLKNMLNN